MRLPFHKISQKPKPFAIAHEDVQFEGKIWHKEERLYGLEARIRGSIELICDRSGEEYTKQLDEHLHYLLCDGLYESELGNDTLEVVEFFDGFADIEFLLQSELESIRLEYHTKDEKE